MFPYCRRRTPLNTQRKDRCITGLFTIGAKAYIGRRISGDPALVVREQNKAERRSPILGAAEKLIPVLGTVEFSMREFAARAHISHYKSYHLLGNKGTVIYTVLHREIVCMTNLPRQNDPNLDP